jgi:hypothetical protein
MSIFNWPNLAPDLSKMREAYHRERRERIATACITGLLSKALPKEATYGGVASGAVIAADALIAELDKEVQP